VRFTPNRAEEVIARIEEEYQRSTKGGVSGNSCLRFSCDQLNSKNIGLSH
jgi:hypothetical protein